MYVVQKCGLKSSGCCRTYANTENLVKFAHVFLRYASRRADKQTNRQTYMLIAILCTHIRGEVKILQQRKVGETSCSYLERLYDVVLVAPEKVCPNFAVLSDPLPANREPAPSHGGSAVRHLQLVEIQVVLHYVHAVVPVQRIAEHDRVGLLHLHVAVCQSQFEIARTAAEIWQFFDVLKTAAAAILDFRNFKFLTVAAVKRVQLRQHDKFRQNRSKNG